MEKQNNDSKEPQTYTRIDTLTSYDLLSTRKFQPKSLAMKILATFVFL